MWWLHRAKIIEPSLTLQQARIAMVRQDLPQRFAFGVPVADPTLGNVVQALKSIRDGYVQQDQATLAREAARFAEVGLPSKRWRQAHTSLLKLCQVAHKQDLPPVWIAMSSHGMKVDRATIQQFLSANCELQLGQSGQENSAPQCTAKLSKDLGQFRFFSGADNIEVGISIFAVSFPNSKLASKISASAGMYDQHMQSATNLTLTEAMDLKKAQKFKLPTSFIELKNVCWCYHRFLAIILGFEHAITGAFGKVVRLLESQEHILHQRFNNHALHCAGFLQCIQIDMFEWMSETFAGREAKVPAFHQVVSNIKRQCWMVPRMPEDFWEAVPLLPETSPTVPAVVPRAPTTPRSNVVVAAEMHLNPNIVPLQPGFQATTFIDAHGLPPRTKRGTLCVWHSMLVENATATAVAEWTTRSTTKWMQRSWPSIWPPPPSEGVRILVQKSRMWAELLLGFHQPKNRR
jgi:hypothetical protein